MTTTTRYMTAEAAYETRFEAVDTKIRALRKHLEEHRVLAHRDPENWGYAGDLGRIEQLLDEILPHN